MFIIPTKLINAKTLNYIELETKNDALHNVTHSNKKINITNDNNSTTRQEVNILSYGEGVEVVNWSKITNNKVNLTNVINIAKDFEFNNPQYEVIGGVNGDYFSTNGTINSNVIYGKRIITPYNHQKYPSLEFDNKGIFHTLHDNNIIESKRHYTITNKASNELLNYGETNVNKPILSKNDSSLLLNYINHIYDDNNTYFEVEIINQISSGQHLFFEGKIAAKTSEISNKTTFVTNNKLLIEVLNTGQTIIVQNEIPNFKHNHMMVGVDGIILENDVIKEFKEMKGQSESNNTSRHPRTGIGFDTEGRMILVTVDGRNPGISNGVNLREFAKIMKNNNIVNGFNIDGGGSTQAIFKVDDELKFVNNPVKEGNGSVRGVANAILMVRKKENIPKFSITENEKSIEINFENNYDNIDFIESNINGKIERKPFSKALIINVPELFYYSLNIKVIANDVAYTIFNNTYYQELDVENATIEITHTYNNDRLIIYMNHNDIHGTINRVQILLKEPFIDENAKETDDNNFVFELEDLNIEDQIKFTIRVRYNDGTYNDITYFVNNDIENEVPNNGVIDSDDTKNLLWLWIVTGVLGLSLIGVMFYTFIYKKRD